MDECPHQSRTIGEVSHLRSFPFETNENCLVGRVAESGGSSRLLVMLITHAHPLRTGESSDMTPTPVVDLPVVECIAKRLMDACQILPGHENLLAWSAMKTWRHPVNRTRSNAVLHARGCVAQKIGFVLAMMANLPQRQFYKSAERLAEFGMETK